MNRLRKLLTEKVTFTQSSQAPKIDLIPSKKLTEKFTPKKASKAK